jgi:hypothetical protein
MAWILIAALALNLLGSGLHPELRQMAVNISVFMILPYSVMGFIVFRAALRRFPSLILITPLAILLPPFAVGLLVLTGILDTWLDFGERMRKKAERNDIQ